MQEAFLRLQTYCRDHTVDNTEAFLVRTVLNLSAQQGRDDRRRQGIQEEVTILALVDPTPGPDEVYAGQQRLLRVKAGLERLSARTRRQHRLGPTASATDPAAASAAYLVSGGAIRATSRLVR